jgi:hypothetical protein
MWTTIFKKILTTCFQLASLWWVFEQEEREKVNEPEWVARFNSHISFTTSTPPPPDGSKFSVTQFHHLKKMKFLHILANRPNHWPLNPINPTQPTRKNPTIWRVGHEQKFSPESLPNIKNGFFPIFSSVLTHRAHLSRVSVSHSRPLRLSFPLSALLIRNNSRLYQFRCFGDQITR